MSILLAAGVEVEVDAPPLPAVTATTVADLIESIDVPTSGLALSAPSAAPAVVNAPGTDQIVVPVAGASGPQGPVGVGAPGPEGPQGPPGQAGAGSYFQSFNFASASTTWVIAHNTGEMALSVELFDTSGDPIEAAVRFPDPNTVEVDWYYPMAGEARLFR